MPAKTNTKAITKKVRAYYFPSKFLDKNVLLFNLSFIGKNSWIGDLRNSGPLFGSVRPGPLPLDLVAPRVPDPNERLQNSLLSLGVDCPRDGVGVTLGKTVLNKPLKHFN